MFRSFLAFALCATAATVFAQDIPDIMRDWKEVDAPPPPALRTGGLIPLDVAGTSLRFGIDPASINIGSDGVVRYVVVATSTSGTVNGIYEGLRCNTGQVRVYARHNPDSGWVRQPESDWVDVYKVPNRRYSLAIARGGACQENAPNGSPAQIILDLKAPADRRFERGGANR